MKKRGRQLDEKDKKIVEKDQTIADLEKNYNLIKYSGDYGPGITSFFVFLKLSPLLHG